MNVLITGGAGYIGSHLAKRLSYAGHVPIAFDNLTAGHRSAVKWGPLIEGDLGDISLLTEVMKKQRIDAVFHCAASAYVQESMQTPGSYFHNNVSNSINVFEAMRLARVRDIVLSSSCAVYGDTPGESIRETCPLNPSSPYGQSKQIAESILRWYGKCHGLRWAALRYFNVAGADSEGEIGESHNPETHILPLTIQAALKQVDGLRIRGRGYRTIDGSAVRDYIHVEDLADCQARTLEFLAHGNGDVILNVGSGVGTSILQLISVVEELHGAPISTRWEEARAGDAASVVADASAAQKAIGWTPRKSDLRTIVQTALNWQRSQLAKQ